MYANKFVKFVDKQQRNQRKWDKSLELLVFWVHFSTRFAFFLLFQVLRNNYNFIILTIWCTLKLFPLTKPICIPCSKFLYPIRQTRECWIFRCKLCVSVLISQMFWLFYVATTMPTMYSIHCIPVCSCYSGLPSFNCYTYQNNSTQLQTLASITFCFYPFVFFFPNNFSFLRNYLKEIRIWQWDLNAHTKFPHISNFDLYIKNVWIAFFCYDIKGKQQLNKMMFEMDCGC